MNMILLLVTLSLSLSTILIIVNTLISKKNMQEREKPSAFECGFDPKSSARLPFSLRFYLIAVIFLVFDVEITLIMPIPMIMGISSMINLNILLTLFVMILIIGLYHEWNQGALEWK